MKTTETLRDAGRQYLSKRSELARRIIENPGHWSIFQYIYENRPGSRLDRLFLSFKLAKAARSKLLSVEDELKLLVKKYASNQCAEVLDIGSGPAFELIHVFSDLAPKQMSVHATCIDFDRAAIDEGTRLARERGIGSHITFVPGDARDVQLDSGRYHIALLMGIMEYFDDTEAVRLLVKIRDSLKPEGHIIITNARRHHMAFLVEFFANWTCIYRDKGQVERILRESGYKDIQVSYEPEALFSMGKGKK
jgi:SAM-dependent methyltransferase